MTVEQWLWTIGDRSIRRKALYNMINYIETSISGTYNGNDEKSSLASAIGGMCLWSRTPEGHQYWSRIQDLATSGDLPVTTIDTMIDTTGTVEAVG